MTSVAQKRITLYATIHHIYRSRKILRLFYEVPANAADFSHACGNGCLLYLPLSSPHCIFIVFLIRVKVKDCAKKRRMNYMAAGQKHNFNSNSDSNSDSVSPFPI